MKTLFTLILLFTLSSLSAQLDTVPPKIITYIEKTVKEIDSLPDSLKIVINDDNSSNKISTIWVTIAHNKIVKIHKTDVFIVSSNFKQPGITTTYYFKHNKLIFSKEHYFTTYYSPLMSVIERADSFYYDYDELVSKPRLLANGGDTTYMHVLLQQEGYNLFKKYCYLLNYNPYANLKYNRVVAYDYEGRGDRLIVNKNKLDKSAILPGKILTPQLQELLINSITDSSTYGGSVAGCFDPHLGIVFYMNDSIVAHVSICFECNSLASSIYLPAEVHNWQVDSGDDYYFVRPLTGFSPQGRKQLKQFCHELGLGKCPEMEDGTIWDE